MTAFFPSFTLAEAFFSFLSDLAMGVRMEIVVFEKDIKFFFGTEWFRGGRIRSRVADSANPALAFQRTQWMRARLTRLFLGLGLLNLSWLREF